jgi:hypothetical protein
MRKRVTNQPIKKKKGFLYFVDKQGDVSAVAMARAGKKIIKKKIKVLKLGIKKMANMLYFVDKDGFASMVPMKRRAKKRRK